MIVMKFGGSSVANPEVIDRVLDIASREIGRGIVLVASAMGKTTDRLVAAKEAAMLGDLEGSKAMLDDLHAYHRETAEAFLTGEFREAALGRIGGYFTELRSLVHGLALLRECTPRSSDAVLSFGELLSTAIIASRARERGIACELSDSREFMITTEDFTGAVPRYDLANPRMREVLRPRPGHLVIAQGFIGRTETGVTTTLGRGGSDFTATIIGAALDAEEVQIWTDVNGIMTCDPRIVPEARTVARISYEEAAELAFFGAKVVHPSTIQPAVEKGIPVLVKNTRDPEGRDTVITRIDEENGILALAGKKNITLVTVVSSRMLNAHGFLRRIFAVFERHRTCVDLVATSEVSVSMTIENTANLDGILRELSEIGAAHAEQDKAILCLVGRGLWKEPSFLVKAFGALGDIPVRMISLGSSDINLSLVVPGKMMDNALRALHEAFF